MKRQVAKSLLSQTHDLSCCPAAPAMAGKKKGKEVKKREGRSVSPNRPAPRPPKSKSSGRKYQSIAIDICEDVSTAVLNRLPPQGPPVQMEQFDQNRWLEEQLELTRQMQRLYAADGSEAACPYLGGSADEYFDSEDEAAWREEEAVETSSVGAGHSAACGAEYADANEVDAAAGGDIVDEADEEGEEGEEGEEAAEASGSRPTSKNSTLRSSSRARQQAAPTRPDEAHAAVEAAMHKAIHPARSHLLFADGELEPFRPFCIGRQADAFPEIEISLARPPNTPTSMQHGLFDRSAALPR